MVWPVDIDAKVDAKVIRDGDTIRGCNGDDCDYCASNRTHAAVKAESRAIALEHEATL